MPKAQRKHKVVKSKGMWKSFKVFVKSLGRHKVPIIIAIILTVGSAVLGLFIPKILGDMTNIAVESYPELDWSSLGQKALIVIILFCASAALNYGQAYILAVVSARYTKELREKIWIRFRGCRLRISISINMAIHCRGWQMTWTC